MTIRKDFLHTKSSRKSLWVKEREVMKLRYTLLFLLSTVSIHRVVATAPFDPAYVAVFFANPYPLSPITSLRGLLMALWSEAQAVEPINGKYTAWHKEHLVVCTQRLLDISTLVDVLCEKHTTAVEDRKSLVALISSLERRVYELTDGVHDDHVGCIKIVLDRIKKKMEQIN